MHKITLTNHLKYNVIYTNLPTNSINIHCGNEKKL